MSEVIETDLVVLGAGPGGYAAAFLAADRGLQVALIDDGPKPGGVCLHVGCIPSKALLHAVHLVSAAKSGAEWGIKFAPPQIDLDVLRARKDKIVQTMANHLGELAKRRKVTYIQGRGKFQDSQTIEVNNGQRVRFKNCIVATGSSPAKIPALSLNSPRVLDSTSALALENIPASLLVIGGGSIGLEMGTVYAELGSQVTVVELTGTLLPGADPDLVRPLANRLEKLFHKIYVNTKVAKIAEVKNGIRATLEGEEVTEKEVTFEKILVSVGRRPNSRDLGLDKTKVEVDERGFIRVDGKRQTTDPHIYAIGDVAGEPMLAHKAAHEGKVAAQVICGDAGVAWDPRAIPGVVYTDPEVAWCGLTEMEARKQKREVEVARFAWGASGRAASMGRTDGLTKILVDPASDQVLGVGIVGPGAGELIAEGVLAMEMGATSRDVAMCIHPHPTLTETLMEGAESLHGMATHLYKIRREPAKK
jgi:dihydrolipoamide dehydrogenase